MEYEFAIIFDLKNHLKNVDPTGALDDVRDVDLIQAVMKHLTLDIETTAEATCACDDMSQLIDDLCHNNQYKEYILFYDEPYNKIFGVLHALCHSILEMLDDVSFYQKLRKCGYPEVEVKRLSRRGYAIMVKRK